MGYKFVKNNLSLSNKNASYCTLEFNIMPTSTLIEERLFKYKI